MFVAPVFLYTFLLEFVFIFPFQFGVWTLTTTATTTNRETKIMFKFRMGTIASLLHLSDVSSQFVFCGYWVRKVLAISCNIYVLFMYMHFTYTKLQTHKHIYTEERTRKKKKKYPSRIMSLCSHWSTIRLSNNNTRGRTKVEQVKKANVMRLTKIKKEEKKKKE